MTGDWLRWVLGVVVVAHGVGHVLFMPLLNGALRLETDGRSWLVSPVLGDGATNVLASVLAGVAGVAFVAAGVGIVAQARASWARSCGSSPPASQAGATGAWGSRRISSPRCCISGMRVADTESFLARNGRRTVGCAA